jgi:hypothetical protein
VHYCTAFNANSLHNVFGCRYDCSLSIVSKTQKKTVIKARATNAKTIVDSSLQSTVLYSLGTYFWMDERELSLHNRLEDGRPNYWDVTTIAMMASDSSIVRLYTIRSTTSVALRICRRCKLRCCRRIQSTDLDRAQCIVLTIHWYTGSMCRGSEAVSNWYNSCLLQIVDQARSIKPFSVPKVETPNIVACPKAPRERESLETESYMHTYTVDWC